MITGEMRMYEEFFGFKEKPFSLVPNPAYLFLSTTHEEAMAHLTYALSQGEGFAEITGEVGTGKTTLCRALLENLDENTESAYIFNPRLDSIQLIKAIHDEFGIPSDADNIKDLIDTLNAFLIAKKAEGKNVVLLIDEAQNLSREVLEQLRLLSNLETSHHKLLQIILVGQPELKAVLDSRDLRQLRQRITLSCHLRPLIFRETKDYIVHRLGIAAKSQPIVFSPRAIRAIYRYSSGIPRLINIACDRALIMAYGLNQKKITGKIAGDAIRELKGSSFYRPFYFQPGSRAIGLIMIPILALAALLLWPSGQEYNIMATKHLERPPEHMVHPIPVPPETPVNPIRESKKPDATVPLSKEKSETASPLPQTLAEFLQHTEKRRTRKNALSVVIKLWEDTPIHISDLEIIEDDELYFHLALERNGLTLYRIKADWTLVKSINLPAIFLCRDPNGSTSGYLTLCQALDESLLLKGGENVIIKAAHDEFHAYWSGIAYLPWKNFFSLRGEIPGSSPGDSIITLKLILKDLGFDDIEISPSFDDTTREAVKKIQKKHGIGVDGVVGSLTKMALYNEIQTLNIPHIRK
jgi:general secretion pathway protein A